MKKTGPDTPRKNPAAVALGKLRAATMTSAERSAAGKARAKALSDARKKEIASQAAKALWAKRKGRKAAK